MDKRFWAIIGVIIAVFVGVLWFNGHKKDQANNSNTTGSSSQNGASNHITGKAGSKVTLVEYGDFQCYYCGQYYPVVEQVVEKYKDQISFQFRNYPLSQNHKNAFAASRAAEAASKQGKFWDMYRLLYANQANWQDADKPQAIFEGYAAQLGLNIGQYRTDYISKAVNDTINADMAAFNKLGMQKATPTYILNGKQIKPELSVEAFSKLIDAELQKQQQAQQ